MILIAAITAAVDAAGNTTTLLFGTQDWTSGGSDTPPDTPCRGRLIEAANFVRDMGDGRSLFGALRQGYGVARISLARGDIDSIARYGYGWRPYELYTCGDEYATLPPFPAGWTKLLSATIESAEFDEASLTLRLRDKFALLDRAICAQYAGAGGVEGPSSVAGSPKPRAYGHVANVEPMLLDASSLIYQVSDRPRSNPRHVYDRRVELGHMSTAFNDAFSFDGLQALSVPPGQVGWWTDGGMFKLGSSPAGKVTVDSVEMTASMVDFYAASRVGQVLYALATDAGLQPAAIDGALQGLDSGGGPPMGVYVRDTTTTYLETLSAVAASRGAWVGVNRLGVLQAGIVAPPAGAPAWTLSGTAAYSVTRVTGQYAVPAKSVTVRGGHNWSPMQAAECAGSVSDADRAAIAQQYTYSERLAGSAAAKHLNARDVTIDTRTGGVRLISPGLPTAVIGISPSAWMDLHGVERDTVEVTVPLTTQALQSVDIGTVGTLRWSRYGFDTGKLMLCIGQRLTFAQMRATFVLWG